MRTVKTGLTVLSFLCSYGIAAQKSTETIAKEIGFSSNSVENMLVVQNVNGPISVEGYDGKTIKIEVEKTISARSQALLEEGRRDIQLKIEEVGQRIYVYLESPWNDFDTAIGRYSNRKKNGRWEQPDYRYYLDFKLKVPKNTNVKLATMNDGDIYAKNVHGEEIIVSNLNGAITLDNITGKTDVNALNRDINITYYKNPSGDSKYHSLNGDVNVTFQADLNAEVSFKSLNGDMYTNYDTEKLSPRLVQTKTKNGKKAKYNMSSEQSYRIGNGGIQLDFNLLNGDATLKK
ncbi:DUF4097 domain-containing protein [Aggregatimonas sangjinii]|uniref:DUF4097 domain-containing protein n=1 Tax=Aggregatimonas sangjinii TaxID=2583587 RepID=A0A5B7SVR9_9FLAO|nr:DUF4097 family beta strand repeat-containing protein [Aggregatimonas sangjinii]QCX01253.1 DUF4097 domain-containing protein [Aggregatimonas sangjinii]